MSRSALFLQQIEAFLERSGMTATGFGRAVANDPNFVADVRNGRRPNIDLVEHVQAFMARHDRDALFESEQP